MPIILAFLLPLTIIAMIFAGFARGAEAAPPTKIVLIEADDFGVNDRTNAGISMPNLAALAGRGVRFNASAPHGVCAPSRAKMLTGRQGAEPFSNENGAVPGTWGITPYSWTIGTGMRAAGYQTAWFGKAHVGTGPGRHPFDLGFEGFSGFIGGAHLYTGGPWWRGREIIPMPGYLTDHLTDKVVGWLGQSGKQFLYVALTSPHTPLVPPPGSSCGLDDTLCIYRAMVATLDQSIGRIVAAAGPNALIIFTGDNGPDTKDSGISAWPLRGAKGVRFDEGGIRVPLIISGPGFAGGRRDERRVSLLDLAPTLLAVAGAPPRASLDGIDLARPGNQGRECLVWGRALTDDAIRCGAWKLHQGELFNLDDDPYEHHPLDNPSKLAELRAKRAAIVASW